MNKYVGVIATHNTGFFHALEYLWKKNKIPVILVAHAPLPEWISLARMSGVRQIYYPGADVKTVFGVEEKLRESGIRIQSFPRKLRTSRNPENIFFPARSLNIPWSSRIANVIFTSGSVQKKGVAHTFWNHYFSARGAAWNMPLSPGDRWLASLPLHHIGGLSLLFRCYLANCGIVFPESPGTKDLITTLLRGNRITHISLVSAQLETLLKEGTVIQYLRKMKAILMGGSKIPASLIHKAISMDLKIYLSYGSSEMSSQICTHRRPPELPADTGAEILPYRKIRVDDSSGIHVGGKTLFKGYMINGKIHALGTGYFPTGDTGEWKIRENTCVRNLRITGREDNMFISGGENIHPERLEDVLNNHPAVENSLVVPIPHEKFGKVPAVFLWLKNTTEKTPLLGKSSPMVQELTEWILASIEKFNLPHWFLNARSDATREILNRASPPTPSIKPLRADYAKAAAEIISGDSHPEGHS